MVREAALISVDDGIKISPLTLINTDKKGGAYPIMLQQFKRAIGVAIVKLKLVSALCSSHCSGSGIATPAEQTTATNMEPTPK